MSLNKKGAVISGLTAFFLLLLTLFSAYQFRFAYDGYSGGAAAPVPTSAMTTETTTRVEYSDHGDGTYETAASERDTRPTSGETYTMTPEDREAAVDTSRARRVVTITLLSLFLFLSLAALVIYIVRFRKTGDCFSIEGWSLGFSLSLCFFAICIYDSALFGKAGALRAQDVLIMALSSGLFVLSIRPFFGWLLNKGDVSWSLLYRTIRDFRKEERRIVPLVLFPMLLSMVSLSSIAVLIAFLVMQKRMYNLESPEAVAAMGLLLWFVFLLVLVIRILAANIRTSRDIQSEIVEEAKTSERYRVDLVANVSHDLRTPLTSIIGSGELLEKENLSDEGRENLRRLNERARYLKEMVDSLFELTKVSSGVLNVREEEIDLIRLLEQTLGLFEEEFTEAGLTVKRSYALETAPLKTDGTLLNQVFSNLFSNAVKYALKGTRVHVEVTEDIPPQSRPVQSQDKPLARYHVRIINVASYAMDFDEKEILERFTRADTARHTAGSGLGLAIAKTYTEVCGGEFFVTTEGDQFTAHVCLIKPEET